jgi:DNA-binding PadR family transcriptional regulator
VLRIAILSLLADRDGTGYELSKAFDSSLTYVWAASQSQIYPELHRLEAELLVEGVDVAQTGRPDKRVYRLTSAGRHHLVEWVAAPPSPLAVRDPFQLHAFNLGRLELAQGRALIEQQRALLASRLDTLRSICDLLEASGHAPGERWNEQLGCRITVEAGLRTTSAYLDWCDWALSQLEASAAAVTRRREGD